MKKQFDYTAATVEAMSLHFEGCTRQAIYGIRKYHQGTPMEAKIVEAIVMMEIKKVREKYAM